MPENKTRIALFLSYLGGGGAERVMLNLAEGFVQCGWQVDLVLAKAWGPHLWKVPAAVRVVDLGASRPLLSLPKLVQYLQREQPQTLLSAMHYANEIAVLAKRLAGVSTQIIVTEHNTLSRSIKRVKGLKQRLIPLSVKYLYPLADSVVTVSQGARDDLQQWMNPTEVKVEAIYNPVIAPDLYEKAAIAVDHPWFQPGEPPVILGVGKLEPQKDFATLIRAFAQVRSQQPCRLAILGWGPDQAELESLIADLGLTEAAALLGYVDNPYAYMARSAVFALSSAWEGLPTVLIEALALGVPVVSTSCESGPEEILDQGKYGHLVPVEDSDAMAKAIASVLCGEYPAVPKDWLKQFEIPNSVEKYLKLMGWPQETLLQSPTKEVNVPHA
ncbi:MAG: glycosyltransferase [Leptolyngbyaceae cyanobacterium SM1_1_3]|nr:glycosyltransferase [Leptolyngbyaceae cyanobacterium SM1_1_3]NJN01309.1 glycosyltransferase [Leptolyngbyaceae cyanobacterium RM1_1_2]NJO09929.1 glycosyltransferase [Leptolyngbyaceae cyanobacterium SL_1_1]